MAHILRYSLSHQDTYSTSRNIFLSKLVCEASYQYLEKTTSRKLSLCYLEAPDYKPYDYINSKYREDYPGHKPQMREKIVPRVKD